MYLPRRLLLTVHNYNFKFCGRRFARSSLAAPCGRTETHPNCTIEFSRFVTSCEAKNIYYTPENNSE